MWPTWTLAVLRLMPRMVAISALGLALRDPEQDLGLAGREHERTPKPGGDRRRVEPRDSGLECGGNRRATPLWLCWRSKSEDEIAD